jgi:hypothetical protein
LWAVARAQPATTARPAPRRLQDCRLVCGLRPTPKQDPARVGAPVWVKAVAYRRQINALTSAVQARVPLVTTVLAARIWWPVRLSVRGASLVQVQARAMQCALLGRLACTVGRATSVQFLPRSIPVLQKLTAALARQATPTALPLAPGP